MDKNKLFGCLKQQPACKGQRNGVAFVGPVRLWAEAKRNFVFMDRVKLNWDSLYVANIPLMVDAQDRNECFRILQRMAAQLGDGHTYVYTGNSQQSAVPFSTVLIDNRVYVDEVQSSFLSKRGIRRGMELVSINGEPSLRLGPKTYYALRFLFHTPVDAA